MTFPDESVVPEVYLHTRKVESLRIVCDMNKYPDTPAYPAVDIGWHCTWYPSMEQLAQMRDAITEFLKAHGTEQIATARTTPEDSSPDEPNKK